MNLTRFYILTVFGVFATLTLFGRQPNSLKVEMVCFGNNNYRNNSVDEFEEELQLKLDITEVEDGNVTEKISFLFREKFASETSLIEVNDTVAVKISVVRAVDFGVKKYLYKIDLFRKKGKCWNIAGGTGLWTEFYPGQVGEGFSVGVPNTVGYLGFKGALVIE